MGWTEERVELLKKLWLEGLSASQIAGVLGEGVTRNAVIGKVHRLKLSGRAKPATSTPRVRSAPRPAARRVSSPASASRSSGLGSVMKARNTISAGAIQGATALKVSEEFAVELEVTPQAAELFIPVEQRLSLLQLNEHTCKWPIGDPLTPDFYFCGQHSDEGKPYCEFHSRRAYHQLDKKKR
ncbi:GcrA family cell cycle regulator [Devosia sp. ZB163]|jgi:GcrA cell cycle regulator|uniref:GcrA family cell cycle regulator n=1 Tax=Devosia sp. ZB163 TaxID=3025938 RepID=UPI002360534E|nr:GcrA family cell cycle regulator [Devosia sp. ZB163]MDC9823434.1 GcrA family cell cycle regulator [Devosia sp. ZB163]